MDGDDWFAPDRVAYLANTFLSYRSDANGAKAGVNGSTRVAATTAADGASGQRKGGFGQQKRGYTPDLRHLHGGVLCAAAQGILPRTVISVSEHLHCSPAGWFTRRRVLFALVWF